MTTLIIHSGGGKCGSSSLQKYFSRLTHTSFNTSKIYYGPKGISDHTRLLSLVYPNKYLRLRGAKPIETAERASYEYLNSLNNHSEAEYIVISSEFFASFDINIFNSLISLLAKYVNFSQVKVVQYARSPDSLYLSLCQQRLKAASTIIPFYSYSINYANLKKLKSINCDEVVLREFSRSSLLNSDIIEDFFYAAFGETIKPDMDIIADNVNVNKSLSAESLCALQIYNAERVSAGLEISMGKQSKRIIRKLRSFDAENHEYITKPTLQSFTSLFLILSHMPTLQNAYQEYGIFESLVHNYNQSDSPLIARDNGYSFSGRGSSFKDIRSILTGWDEQITGKALDVLNSINSA